MWGDGEADSFLIQQAWRLPLSSSLLGPCCPRTHEDMPPCRKVCSSSSPEQKQCNPHHRTPGGLCLYNAAQQQRWDYGSCPQWSREPHPQKPRAWLVHIEFETAKGCVEGYVDEHEEKSNHAVPEGWWWGLRDTGWGRGVRQEQQSCGIQAARYTLVWIQLSSLLCVCVSYFMTLECPQMKGRT